MPAGFESYDSNGNLQFTSEAQAYCAIATGSVSVTAQGTSYGYANISLTNGADLVAFRSSTCYNMSGYRSLGGYKIITQALSGSISYKIIRPFSALSASVDSMGLQLFGADGSLQYSALQSSVFVYDIVSVYGEDLIGDVGGFLTCPANSNPYALILGNELIAYTGAQEQDSYERTICISSTTSDTINVASADRNSWPGMPSSGGVSYPGDYTVAAVY